MFFSRKHEGQSLVCDESVYSEDSGNLLIIFIQRSDDDDVRSENLMAAGLVLTGRGVMSRLRHQQPWLSANPLSS